MKKLILALFVLTTLSGQLMAQNLYTEVFATYQMPIGGLTEMKWDWNDPPDGGFFQTAEVSRVNLNWGRGLGEGLLVGSEIGQYTGAELRMSYFPSTRTAWGEEGTSENYESEVIMRFVRVEPALRLRLGDGTCTWYVALGPSFALFPEATSRYEFAHEMEGDGSTSIIGRTTFGGVGYGGFVAAGWRYGLGERLGVMAEVNCTAQSWSPMRSELTEYTYFGFDRMPYLSLYESATEYVNSFTYEGQPDLDSPQKQLRFHYPMSTWGVRIGVSYAFGKKES